MILYVNGCSWGSLSNETADGKVYGDFLSEKLNCQSINHSMPASCNDRIIRSTIRNLEKLKASDQDIVCVINLSTLARSELWDAECKIKQNLKLEKSPVLQLIVDRLDKSNDGDFINYIINEPLSSHLTDQVPEYALHVKSTVLNFHPEKEFYNLYYRLFMLICYLKQNKIKYLIFAGSSFWESISDSDLDWITTFKNPVMSDHAVLDFETLNFCKWAKDNNLKFFDEVHPGEAAHAAWADLLYNKLTKLYGPL